MIVADTSALVTISAADVLDLVLTEFDVHATATVESELRETADYDDAHAEAAQACLDGIDRIEIHEIDEVENASARVDEGEGSCVTLARRHAADFLLTDDLRAVPELEALTDAQVAISPIVLRALVKRGILEPHDAMDRLDTVTEIRSWLSAPIYQRGRSLLSDTDAWDDVQKPNANAPDVGPIRIVFSHTGFKFPAESHSASTAFSHDTTIHAIA